MRLGIVLGQVVSTVKNEGLSKGRLLVVDFLDEENRRQNTTHVAMDTIGAGVSEVVLLVSGSSARKTFGNDAPIDLSIVGIVDEVTIDNKITYQK